MRVSSRLTTKPGASRTTHARLRELARQLRTRSRASASLVAGVRTSSTSGMSATGLKKCMPTLGAQSPSRRPRATRCSSRGCSPASTTSRELGEDLAASPPSPRRRPRARGRSPRSRRSRRAGDDRGEEARLVAVEPPSRRGASSSSRIESTRAVDDLLLEVAEDDRHLEPAQEERARAASPSGPRRRCRPSARGAARRPGCRAVASRAARRGRTRRSRPAPAARAGARRSPPPPARWPSSSSRSRRPRSGRARGTARASRRARRRRRCAAPGARSSRRSVQSGSLALDPGARRARRAYAIDSSTNSTGSSTRSASPSSSALARVEQPVLAQRVLDDQLDGRLRRRSSRGDQLRAAPGREEAEEHLREAEVADRSSRSSAPCSGARARAPPPRQAPLIAATVGNGSARMRSKSSWPARLPSARGLGGCTFGNSSMSAPAQKTERLAGEHGAGPVARLRARSSSRSSRLERARGRATAASSSPRRCRS